MQIMAEDYDLRRLQSIQACDKKKTQMKKKFWSNYLKSMRQLQFSNEMNTFNLQLHLSMRTLYHCLLIDKVPSDRGGFATSSAPSEASPSSQRS